MAVNPKALAKALALVAWADEKLDKSELKATQAIFDKYGIPWNEAKTLFESAMEDLLEADGDDDSEDISIGVLDFGEVDFRDVLDDLAELVMADKVADYKELEMMHTIGKACNVDPVVISGCLLRAAQKHKPELPFAE